MLSSLVYPGFVITVFLLLGQLAVKACSTAAKGYDCAFCDKSTNIGILVVVYIYIYIYIYILAGYPASLVTLPLPPPPSHSSLHSALPPSDYPASARIFGVSSLKITPFPRYIFKK